MKIELYVSRDQMFQGGFDGYALWKTRPKWNNRYREFRERPTNTLGCFTSLNFKILFLHLHLEPGQLATVNREEKDGVVKLALGKVIESH